MNKIVAEEIVARYEAKTYPPDMDMYNLLLEMSDEQEKFGYHENVLSIREEAKKCLKPSKCFRIPRDPEERKLLREALRVCNGR